MNSSIFRSLLFSKLPIAYIAGLKLNTFNDKQSIVSVKLKWLNQNPFNSMFWAVQGMAAELSTGIICMSYIKDSNLAVSMLVIEQQAKFLKKAKGKILFICEDGNEIKNTIQKAIDEKKPQTIVVKSIGKDEAGDVVSEFKFTWSFKAK